jgi:hypothetical protein
MDMLSTFSIQWWKPMALARKSRKETKIDEAELGRFTKFKGDMRTELYRASLRR